MFIRLLILLILLPILEIFVLIESGRLLGVWPTVLLVISTGVAGSWLMRQQGIILLSRIQSELSRGHLPTRALLDGGLIIAGGVLLLTPGFCTDLLGFTVLLPPTRQLWRRWLERWLAAKLAQGHLTVHRF